MQAAPDLRGPWPPGASKTGEDTGVDQSPPAPDTITPCPLMMCPLGAVSRYPWLCQSSMCRTYARLTLGGGPGHYHYHYQHCAHWLVTDRLIIGFRAH